MNGGEISSRRRFLLQYFNSQVPSVTNNSNFERAATFEIWLMRVKNYSSLSETFKHKQWLINYSHLPLLELLLPELQVRRNA